MKLSTLRKGCTAVGILALATSGSGALPSMERDRLPARYAQIAAADGTMQNVTLEGVGCTASMCSRTMIKVRTEFGAFESAALDTIASIEQPTETQARFVMKDGTQRQVNLLPGFRVLYLRDGRRLDLASVRSITFTTPSSTLREGGR